MVSALVDLHVSTYVPSASKGLSNKACRGSPAMELAATPGHGTQASSGGIFSIMHRISC